jgi:hypothetical protein
MKKPAGIGPPAYSKEKFDEKASDFPAKDSGEDWRQSQDNHHPSVGGEPVPVAQAVGTGRFLRELPRR